MVPHRWPISAGSSAWGATGSWEYLPDVLYLKSIVYIISLDGHKLMLASSNRACQKESVKSDSTQADFGLNERQSNECYGNVQHYGQVLWVSSMYNCAQYRGHGCSVCGSGKYVVKELLWLQCGEIVPNINGHRFKDRDPERPNKRE